MEDEAKKSKETAEGKPEGVKKENPDASLSTIEQARAIQKENKEQLDRRESLVAREEAMMAEKIVSGTADAGQEEVKETEDEKWAKDAKKRYEGTGMDPTPEE